MKHKYVQDYILRKSDKLGMMWENWGEFIKNEETSSWRYWYDTYRQNFKLRKKASRILADYTYNFIRFGFDMDEKYVDRFIEYRVSKKMNGNTVVALCNDLDVWKDYCESDLGVKGDELLVFADYLSNRNDLVLDFNDGEIRC